MTRRNACQTLCRRKTRFPGVSKSRKHAPGRPGAFILHVFSRVWEPRDVHFTGVLHYLVTYGYAWLQHLPHMATSGHIWIDTATYGHIWPPLAMHPKRFKNRLAFGCFCVFCSLQENRASRSQALTGLLKTPCGVGPPPPPFSKLARRGSACVLMWCSEFANVA